MNKIHDLVSNETIIELGNDDCECWMVWCALILLMQVQSAFELVGISYPYVSSSVLIIREKGRKSNIIKREREITCESVVFQCSDIKSMEGLYF